MARFHVAALQLAVVCASCATAPPAAPPPVDDRAAMLDSIPCETVDELNRAYFDSMSALLTREARDRLGENMRILQRCAQILIRINGYTDDLEENPPALSKLRADAVRSFYVEAGLEPDRIGEVVGRERDPSSGLDGIGIDNPVTGELMRDPQQPGDSRARRGDTIPSREPYVSPVWNDELQPAEAPEGAAYCPNITELNPVYFDPYSAELSDEARRLLDENMVILSHCPAIQVTTNGYVHAYAEDVTLPEADLLSQARADAVETYYVQHGLGAERAQAIGRGMEPTVGVKWTDEEFEQILRSPGGRRADSIPSPLR